MKTLKKVASKGEIKYLLRYKLIKRRHIREVPIRYKFDGAHNFLFEDGLIVIINPQVEPQAGFDKELFDWESI